jgi:MATE family multidrug resistance protein
MLPLSQHRFFRANPDRLELVRTAVPLATSAFSFALMSAVDTAFVTGLGVAELAGVGLAGTLIFTVIITTGTLLRGLKICMAKAEGRGEASLGYLGAGLRLGARAIVPTVVLLVALGFLTPTLLSTAASATAARDYIWVRTLSIPMLFPLMALREAFYGRGDTTTPLRAIVAANVLNLVLNWVSVELLHWGVRGVAFTTVMAVALQVFWLGRVQRPRGFGLREATPAHTKELLTIGLPFASQKLLETGAFAGIAAMISRTGDTAAAAHQIGLQLLLLGNLPSVALGEAVSLVAGRLAGAGEHKRAREAASFALRVGVGWASGVALLAAVLAPTLGPRLVPGDDEIVVVLWACAALLVLECTSLVAQGYLRATGDPRYPSVVVMINATVISPALAALGIFGFGLRALAGWLSFLVEVTASSVLLWRRIQQRTAA